MVYEASKYSDGGKFSTIGKEEWQSVIEKVARHYRQFSTLIFLYRHFSQILYVDSRYILASHVNLVSVYDTQEKKWTTMKFEEQIRHMYISVESENEFNKENTPLVCFLTGDSTFTRYEVLDGRLDKFQDEVRLSGKVLSFRITSLGLLYLVKKPCGDGTLPSICIKTSGRRPCATFECCPALVEPEIPVSQNYVLELYVRRDGKECQLITSASASGTCLASDSYFNFIKVRPTPADGDDYTDLNAVKEKPDEGDKNG